MASLESFTLGPRTWRLQPYSPDVHIQESRATPNDHHSNCGPVNARTALRAAKHFYKLPPDATKGGGGELIAVWQVDKD